MACMKLRVRAAAGGPTVRVQVPILCSLQGLKDTLSPLISLPSVSFSLSLNKKDALEGPGTTLLSSFGVTNGDLLFYLVESGDRLGPCPASSSSQPSAIMAEGSRPSRAVSRSEGAKGPTSHQVGSSMSTANAAATVAGTLSVRDLCALAATRRATVGHSVQVAAEEVLETPTAPVTPPSSGPASVVDVDNSEDLRAMYTDIQVEEGPASFDSFTGRRLLIPDLLQRVLAQERENVHQASSYLVLAVHAVMLETGFVRVDNGCLPSERPGLPPGWSGVGNVNLVYSLPEILSNASVLESARKEQSLLRCQIVGNAVVVYGAVTGGTVHRVSLSVKKHLHKDVLLSFSSERSAGQPRETGTRGTANKDGTLRSALSAKEDEVFCNIFNLWKDVKDSLSLPLLTLMCEKAGLPPPPSLLRLPTELKTKVLELLPAGALASLACVSSELRFLTANEEIWKQQYRKEFGSVGERAPGGHGWKNAFIREWEHRRRREEERREAERYFRNDIFPPGSMLRAPYPPRFGGLDYFHGPGGDSFGGVGGFRPDGGGGFRQYGFRGGQPAEFPSRRGVGIRDYILRLNRDDATCLLSRDSYGYEGGFVDQGVQTWPMPRSLPVRGSRSLGPYSNSQLFNVQTRLGPVNEGDYATFFDVEHFG